MNYNHEASGDLWIENLVQTFEQDGKPLHILNGINLRVKHGEFVSLLGPSGCGKSTLLQNIGGLLTPKSGRVILQGKDITGQKGHISYMPQQPALLPWRDVLSNVVLGSEIAGVKRSQMKAKAVEWLEKAGLASFAHAYPHMLSGGMQQRVSFVRAMLSPQSFMCLDEPFGALDAITRLEMQQWLLQIWEEHRKTVLLITHSIEEALLLSDRIYVFSPRPAKVIQQHLVPFARPRREELIYSHTFNELKSDIYRTLKGSMASAHDH
ncbi:ABC transporter ATP-binding protein [Marinicrinis lubricantis]|uniref:ABC transporter ATP-binding protein n=1 Tax=Marinicrinis lubricantis TaxID=2086470 RepID=A0ABW1IUJ6_9BACL